MALIENRYYISMQLTYKYFPSRPLRYENRYKIHARSFLEHMVAGIRFETNFAPSIFVTLTRIPTNVSELRKSGAG